MVSVEAIGPVRRRPEYKSRGEDGNDEYRTSATVTERAELHIHVEFPSGHVNLEAYALSHYLGSPSDPVELLVGCGDLPDEWEPANPDRWEIEMYGSPDEWIEQAGRWTSERPNMTVLDALRIFSEWEETGNGPDRAFTRYEREHPEQ